jgi:hypothetical protein
MKLNYPFMNAWNKQKLRNKGRYRKLQFTFCFLSFLFFLKKMEPLLTYTCSDRNPQKDKTTVLTNAASYLKALEAQVSELEEKNAKLERHVPRDDGGGGTAATAAAVAHRRARVHVARAAPGEPQVSVTVMVMVECDIVDLVLRVLECLRWMGGVVSVLSVDADTYSPQAMLKALANIKLHIVVLHVCTHRSCMHALRFTSSF